MGVGVGVVVVVVVVVASEHEMVENCGTGAGNSKATRFRGGEGEGEGEEVRLRRVMMRIGMHRRACWIEPMDNDHEFQAEFPRESTIVDVGCGVVVDGDMISKWDARRIGELM